MGRYFLLLVCFFFLKTASAASINVNAGGYVGIYLFNGSGSWYAGNNTVNLAQGNHTIDFMFGSSVSFTVNLDGTVTSGDLDVMSHSGSTLTFNTVDVDFNLGLYNNTYQFTCYQFQVNSGTFKIPVDSVIAITVPPCNITTTFSADSSGNVTILTNNDGFEAVGNQINFLPVKIDIDPVTYGGVYSLYGKGHMVGATEQYLLPNSSYAILAETGLTLGTVTTNTTGIVPSSNNYYKADGGVLSFYASRYTVTPPSGYSLHYNPYGHGNMVGVQNIWLLRGGPSSLYAQYASHNYTATSDCTSFSVSTAAGNFNFDCDNDAALYFDPLTEDGFNDIDFGFISKRYDGRFSTTIGDYDLTVNGASVNISGADLSRDTFHESSAFVQGRNVAVFDGEDEDSNPFTITKTFWAGGAEVTVETQGATDTVTLTVEQTISGTTYRQSVVQEAVSNSTVFENIPQITNGVVYVSTTRGQKVIRNKLPQRSIISL